MRLSSLAEMTVGFVHPPNHGVSTGNLATALRWQSIVDEFGCESFLCAGGDDFEKCWDAAVGDSGDKGVMVALNAVKSHREIVAYRKLQPQGLLIVAVTGTDLNGGDARTFGDSLTLADRIVVLQEKAFEKLPLQFQKKAVTIFQSVPGLAAPTVEKTEDFQICVVGHLRHVKDPLRCAMATRLLPPESKIVLQQAGAILDGDYRPEVAREECENPRYRYLGELTSGEARLLIMRSDLLVITSLSEGGPLVVAEAVVSGTPVISSGIDGVVGMLGADYPGYFEVGDEQALAELLSKFERDESFRRALGEAIGKRAFLFEPHRESALWRELLSAGTGISNSEVGEPILA